MEDQLRTYLGEDSIEYSTQIHDLGIEESRKERKITRIEDLSGTFAFSENDYTGNN